MPLAMLPNKSLQHCQEQMIRAIIRVKYIRLKQLTSNSIHILGANYIMSLCLFLEFWYLEMNFK